MVAVATITGPCAPLVTLRPRIERHRVPNRGHQVGQALAGAGAGLHEQMLARRHRVLGRPHHRQLPVARLAADALDRERE